MSHSGKLCLGEDALGGLNEMVSMEQIAEVRLSLARGESRRSIARRCGLSRNTVSKIADSGLTEFRYKKRKPAYPAVGPFLGRLKVYL
jgi:transposase